MEQKVTAGQRGFNAGEVSLYQGNHSRGGSPPKGRNIFHLPLSSFSWDSLINETNPLSTVTSIQIELERERVDRVRLGSNDRQCPSKISSINHTIDWSDAAAPECNVLMFLVGPTHTGTQTDPHKHIMHTHTCTHKHKHTHLEN